MRCMHVVTIFNKVSGRREFVPCGKCNFCLQAKRSDWTFRLLQEDKVSKSSHFITFTYEDDQLPESGDLSKRDCQLFIKRLRQENVAKVRHFTVGEYGSRTLRPHYHSIVFNLLPNTVNRLDRIWGKGIVHVGDVTRASIHYVAKYMINRVGDFGGREPPFSLMSRRPGIGVSYVASMRGWHLDDMRNYSQVNGIKGRLPRYLRDKIFSKEQREQLSSEIDSKELYLEELERLKAFHDDPSQYFAERLRASHDKIRSKLFVGDMF